MRLGVAEHILGQELRGAELRVFQRLHAAGDAALAGLAQEAARRAARELEHLAALLERVQRDLSLNFSSVIFKESAFFFN